MRGAVSEVVPDRSCVIRAGGGVITRKFLTNRLGFKCITLYTNVLQVNATLVERILHERMQHLPLGVRLQRDLGCGDNGGGQTDFKTEVHHVFLTYSTKVLGAIESGDVVVMH